MTKIREGMEFKFGYWKEGDNYYKESTIDGKLVLKLQDRDKVEKKIQTAAELARTLVDDLDGEKVLLEAIMKLDDKKLKLLDKAVSNEYNVVTRLHYCVDMKIGNLILPIIE